jgi:4-amino-4-deoxy-L-arabinose transferase-like glycosyltransferase
MGLPMKVMSVGDAAGGGRRYWLTLAFILVVALAVRLPEMGARSFWIDELFTRWFVSQTFHDLWFDVPDYETHPPFYYSILKLWALLAGGDEFGLRSLSLLFSLATVLVVGISGKLIGSAWTVRAAALLGAALLAVNFANIRDAQNARPYALQTFVCTVAILAAIVLVVRLRRGAGPFGGNGGWAAPACLLGLFAGLGLWIHNTGFFIALGIWTGLFASLPWILRDERLKALKIFFGAGLLALALWLPYLPIFLEQSRRFSNQAFWLIPSARDLYSAWMLLLGGHWAALALAIALLGIGVFRLSRQWPGVAILIASILVLPLYTLLAVSFAWKPIYIQRLFDWMVPLGLTVVGIGLLTFTRRVWPRIVVGLVVFIVSIGQTIADQARPIDDWKGIVAAIARDARPGDVVIAVPAEGSIAVDYYAGRYPDFPPIVCVPGCYPQRDLDRVYVSNLGAPMIVDADAAIVDSALATYGRVWLVQVSISLYDPRSIVRSRIAASRKFVRYEGNSLAKVELFE